MRCFIAIEIPENIKLKFKELRKHFNNDVARLNWVEDPHLTLKFLGEINESKLEKVKKYLSEIKFKHFSLKLDKIGGFPKERGFIRVIWIGVTPKRRIAKLREDIDDALVYLFERDKKFEPHITIGRVKVVKDKDKFRKFFELQIEGSFKVNSFKLIKSELTESGAKYETLEEYS